MTHFKRGAPPCGTLFSRDPSYLGLNNVFTRPVASVLASGPYQAITPAGKVNALGSNPLDGDIGNSDKIDTQNKQLVSNHAK